MPPSAKATELANKYAKVITFAAAKEWRKWSRLSSLERPFESAELDQWALEAILIMGGLMKTGPNSQTMERGRKLQTFAECKDITWVQRNVDLYVRDKAGKAVKSHAAEVRRGSAAVNSLDAALEIATDDGEGSSLAERLGNAKPMESAPALFGLKGIVNQYPALWLTGVAKYAPHEARDIMGVSKAEFERLRDVEARALWAWGMRNRRIQRDTPEPLRPQVANVA